LTPEERQATEAELIEAAGELATSDDILGLLREELNRCGIVGGEGCLLIPELSFCSAYSTLLRFRVEKPQPVSARVQGGTGTGKSFEVMAGLRYTPEEEAWEIWTSSGSQRALAYSGDKLARKIIVFPEAGELADPNSPAVNALNSLLAEGRISHTVTVEDPGAPGGFSTVTVHCEGPTGAIICSALTALEPQVESRLMQVSADDSTEQTRRILNVTSLEAEGGLEYEPDFEPWHALWRLRRLGAPYRVHVPFATIITNLVDERFSTWRRDGGQLMQLVKTIALLHMDVRERDESGAIVAAIDDYEHAYRLLEPGLAERTRKGLSKTLTQTIEKMPVPPGAIGQRELARKRSIAQSTAGDHLRRLEQLGFIERTPDRKYVRLGEESAAQAGALPAPARVEAEMLRMCASEGSDSAGQPVTGAQTRMVEPKKVTGSAIRSLKRPNQAKKPEMTG
jgi:hypothetical protein